MVVPFSVWDGAILAIHWAVCLVVIHTQCDEISNVWKKSTNSPSTAPIFQPIRHIIRPRKEKEGEVTIGIAGITEVPRIFTFSSVCRETSAIKMYE